MPKLYQMTEAERLEYIRAYNQNFIDAGVPALSEAQMIALSQNTKLFERQKWAVESKNEITKFWDADRLPEYNNGDTKAAYGRLAPYFMSFDPKKFGEDKVALQNVMKDQEGHFLKFYDDITKKLNTKELLFPTSVEQAIKFRTENPKFCEALFVTSSALNFANPKAKGAYFKDNLAKKAGMYEDLAGKDFLEGWERDTHILWSHLNDEELTTLAEHLGKKSPDAFIDLNYEQNERKMVSKLQKHNQIGRVLYDAGINLYDLNVKTYGTRGKNPEIVELSTMEFLENIVSGGGVAQLNIYKGNSCIGMSQEISLDGGKITLSKPKVCSTPRDFEKDVKDFGGQLQILKDLQNDLAYTDPFYVINSPEFREVKGALSSVIKLQENLVNKVGFDNIGDLKEAYKNLDDKLNKYLEVKADKIKARDDGDERGQLRVNVIKSLKSITSQDHIERVFDDNLINIDNALYDDGPELDENLNNELQNQFANQAKDNDGPMI